MSETVKTNPYEPSTMPAAPRAIRAKDAVHRMSVAELRLLPEFLELTQKQQLFVVTYCGGGLVDGVYDAVKATFTAYPCKSMDTARVMSYALLCNIRIVAVLNRHFNREPIEEFLTTLDRAIHNRRLTLAQIQALRLKCDILGFATRLPAEGSVPDVIPKRVRKPYPKRKAKAPKPPEQPATPKSKSAYEIEADRF